MTSITGKYTNPHYRSQKNKKRLSNTWQIMMEDKHYVRVYIWNDKEAMYENVLSGGDPEWEGGFMGCFLEVGTIVNGEDVYVAKFFGEIHLVLNKFGSGVVAHEIAHCVLAWAHIVGFDSDEEFCLMMGNLVRKFWIAFYKRYDARSM